MVVAFLFSCTPYLSLVESTFLRSHCATPPCGPTVLCAKVSLSTCRRSNFGLPRYGFHNRSPQSETGIGDGGRCTSHPGGGGATRHTILRVAIVCHPHTHGTGLWDIVLVHPQHTGVPAHTGIAWCVCGSDTSHVMAIIPMSTPPTARTAPTELEGSAVLLGGMLWQTQTRGRYSRTRSLFRLSASTPRRASTSG